MAAEYLSIALDTDDVSALLADLLEALEGLPKLVQDGFLDRLDALLSDGGNSALRSAPGAGDNVRVLQLSIGGLDELIAAARSASQVDGTGHGGLHAG